MLVVKTRQSTVKSRPPRPCKQDLKTLFRLGPARILFQVWVGRTDGYL